MKYLKEKFHNDLLALNDAFGLNYWSNRIDAWEDFPDVRGTINGSLGDEFEKFQRSLVDKFLLWQAGIISEYKREDQFITHNFDFEWRGQSYGVQPEVNHYQAAKALTIAGCDIYHPNQDALTGEEIALGGDLTRSLKQDNYLIIETEAQGYPCWTPYKGQLRLNAYSHLASGANSVMYWHWHSLHNSFETYWKGVLSHDFQENAVYKEASIVGNEWKEIGTHLVNLKKKNDVAIMVSNESLTALKWFGIKATAAGSGDLFYNDVLRYVYNTLYRMNIECDFIWPQSENLSDYKVVIVPAMYAVSDEVLVRMREYVRDGGSLLTTFKTAFTDEYVKVSTQRQPRILSEVHGIHYDEFTFPKNVGLRGVLGEGTNAKEFMELVSVDTATVLASYDHPAWGEYAAITEQGYGKGMAYYLACMTEEGAVSNLKRQSFSLCKITKGRHLQKCRPSVYNLGVKQNNIPLNYTEYGTGYQRCLPINQEIQIPADDPVRLLSAVVERMDLSALYSTYSEEGRNQYSPSVLLKICILGYSRKAISSRAIEQACRENIKYMYLLNGENPPDHNTIARFRSKHLAECQDQILAEMTRVLMDMGEVSFAESAVFIDGTKIESVGNKYKFVWKKSAEKNLNRLQDTMRKELPDMLKSLGLKLRAGDVIKAKHLKKARKQICALMEKEGIQKVSGTGKRQSLHQKTLKKIEDWIGRIERYTSQIYLCGDRSSYCKTDTEATFMRMKEDHMLNGQLKPGYNVNVATVSEYIVGTYVSSDRTDTKTTIPFMEKLMKSYTAIERVVYDSGYESEENYRFFDEHPSLDLYVKPANHEQKKKKKYRTDISRRENMDYNEKDDTYTCAEGKVLIKTGTRKSKTSTGYVSEKTIYECSACKGCPRKAECIRSKSKTPLEERSKRIEVAKYFNEKRDSMESKIMTGEGKQLRMNRSIQAEGVFAYVKTDLSFRRFLTKGIKKVGAEWTLLAMAYNILRMHHKGQNGRLGTHLYSLAA